MRKVKIIFGILIFFLLLHGILISKEFTLIAAGVAFFFQGMSYMNSGLKVFSGGILESTLKYITGNLWKSIGFGIIATTIIQSSSVVSVIIISFLSAGIINLYSAIGVIIGSNLGATVVAWVIALYGININLIVYALPLIIFGVSFKNNTHNKIEGLGAFLLGIGFLLVGIDYLKDGFLGFNSYLQINNVDFNGYFDILLYTMIGVVATVIMQSTNALMILLLTTLKSNYNLYYHVIAIAIGSNIGTTVTAILGSINSSIDGKRLALVHVLFNCATAFIVIIFFKEFIAFTGWLAAKFEIEDYSLKLALFHSLFNMIGILIFLPFLHKVSNFSKRIFNDTPEVDHYVDELSIPTKRIHAKYLDQSISYPDVALRAIIKEIQRLYKNTYDIICYAILIKPSNLLVANDYNEILKLEYKPKQQKSITELYSLMIKGIYSDILEFSNTLDLNLSSQQSWELFRLQTSCRHFVSAIKHIKLIHKNMQKYITSNNNHAKEQYDKLRLRIIKTLIVVDKLGLHRNYTNINPKISALKQKIEEQDKNINVTLNYLLNNTKIDSLMATSLLNDSNHVRDACLNLIDGVKIMIDKHTRDFVENDNVF